MSFEASRNIIWEPHPGSQTRFLTCPAWECLLSGSRGSGKTDCLIMDYAQDVGKGFGSDYRGIIFRKSYTQLTDFISKTKQFIPRIFPEATYNGSTYTWTFKDGEELLLRYVRTLDDYYNYHGFQFCYVGFEELTTWSSPDLYLKLMSINRSSNPDIPRKYRSTTNPGGPGMGWVKQRFVDAGMPGKIVRDELGHTRTWIDSRLQENLTLMNADPGYAAKLKMMTKDDKNLYKAWVLGSWDIIAGGFFTDVFDRVKHVFNPFPIPVSWKVTRSFDWGSAKPWAVTYGAESNGEQPSRTAFKIANPGIDMPYFPRGSIIVIDEIYGSNGNPNQGDRATSQEIAQRVLAKDNALMLEYGFIRIYTGPADTAIYNIQDGTSIGKNLASFGLYWTRAYKGPGSRVTGWSLVRGMLGSAKRNELETPGLFFFTKAHHHIRTLPMLQHDQKHPEDVATDSDDHCFVYDTKILTDQGIQRIGDLVGTSGKILTVNGVYENYSKCRLLKRSTKIIRVAFDDGHTVECTPDHKFLTTKGFVEAQHLAPSDTSCIVSLKTTRSSKCAKLQLFQRLNRYLKGLHTTYVGSIFNEMVLDYIPSYGSITMAQFQKDTTFITKMRSKLITQLKTMSYYMVQNTDLITCTNETRVYPNRNVYAIFKRPELKLLNGIKVKQGVSGIKKYIINKLRKLYIETTTGSVLTAVNNAQAVGRMIMRTVADPAKQHDERNQELTTLKEFVSYVPAHLQSISTQNAKPVPVVAGKNYLLGISKIDILKEHKDVYCLEVDNTHTFALENGVIVSNCADSMRYLLARKLISMKRHKISM